MRILFAWMLMGIGALAADFVKIGLFFAPESVRRRHRAWCVKKLLKIDFDKM